VSINRYEDDDLVQQGRLLGTNKAIIRVRDGIRSGEIKTVTRVLSEAQRLDIVAGQQYGDGRLWWMIAAASGIGWWPQVPAGTRLVIPVDSSEVEALL
jgi:hypothetical protein